MREKKTERKIPKMTAYFVLKYFILKGQDLLFSLGYLYGLLLSYY